MSDRYNKEYIYGEVSFYLSDFTPDIEECRILILKVLEQTIRDYLSLKDSSLPSDRESWESANDFLFNSEHKILWGDLDLFVEEYLDIVDLDIHWVRDQVRKKLKGVKYDRSV